MRFDSRTTQDRFFFSSEKIPVFKQRHEMSNKNRKVGMRAIKVNPISFLKCGKELESVYLHVKSGT